MKHLGSIVHSLLGGIRQDEATTQRKQIYRDWDRERRNALTPSDLAEIDAIVARALSTTPQPRVLRLADRRLPRGRPGGILRLLSRALLPAASRSPP